MEARRVKTRAAGLQRSRQPGPRGDAAGVLALRIDCDLVAREDAAKRCHQISLLKSARIFADERSVAVSWTPQIVIGSIGVVLNEEVVGTDGLYK